MVIRPYKLDLLNPESVRNFAHTVERTDTVVRNAGTLKAASCFGFYDTTTRGVRNVSDALAAQGKLPKRVVHISSQLVGADLALEKLRFIVGASWHSILYALRKS